MPTPAQMQRATSSQEISLTLTPAARRQSTQVSFSPCMRFRSHSVRSTEEKSRRFCSLLRLVMKFAPAGLGSFVSHHLAETGRVLEKRTGENGASKVWSVAIVPTHVPHLLLATRLAARGFLKNGELEVQSFQDEILLYKGCCIARTVQKTYMMKT